MAEKNKSNRNKVLIIAGIAVGAFLAVFYVTESIPAPETRTGALRIEDTTRLEQALIGQDFFDFLIDIHVPYLDDDEELRYDTHTAISPFVTRSGIDLAHENIQIETDPETHRRTAHLPAPEIISSRLSDHGAIDIISETENPDIEAYEQAFRRFGADFAPYLAHERGILDRTNNLAADFFDELLTVAGAEPDDSEAPTLPEEYIFAESDFGTRSLHIHPSQPFALDLPEAVSTRWDLNFDAPSPLEGEPRSTRVLRASYGPSDDPYISVEMNYERPAPGSIEREVERNFQQEVELELDEDSDQDLPIGTLILPAIGERDERNIVHWYIAPIYDEVERNWWNIVTGGEPETILSHMIRAFFRERGRLYSMNVHSPSLDDLQDNLDEALHIFFGLTAGDSYGVSTRDEWLSLDLKHQIRTLERRGFGYLDVTDIPVQAIELDQEELPENFRDREHYPEYLLSTDDDASSAVRLIGRAEQESREFRDQVRQEDLEILTTAKGMTPPGFWSWIRPEAPVLGLFDEDGISILFNEEPHRIRLTYEQIETGDVITTRTENGQRLVTVSAAEAEIMLSGDKEESLLGAVLDRWDDGDMPDFLVE